MGRWRRLPAEIRSIILEMVADDYRFKFEQYALAGYASVCREWQPVFEKRNFQRLVLDQDRIYNLEQVLGTGKRRDYLKHLFLRVRLCDYDCKVCKSKENHVTIRNNRDTVSRAVWALLIILSKWSKFAGSRRQNGITLELGIYSPGDSKHAFKDLHLDHKYLSYEEKELETCGEVYKLRDDELGLDSLNDPYHWWVNGHRDGLSLESKQRITGTIIINSNLPEFSMFFQTFPEVKIVTGLLIRRQFYRKIAPNCLSKLFRETFTCLQWFRHEVWHDVDPQQQLCFERNYKSLILHHLPSTLQELYIFEDFNQILHPERSIKRANPGLGRALAKSSRCLQILSVAFLVDAKDFFASVWPTNAQELNVVPWENLRNLALTSCLLHPEIGRGKINKLLVAAGQASAFMPALEVMEIWNGGEGHACVFQYRNNIKERNITWASNWGIDVQLDHNVVQCWANLARHGQHPHHSLKTAVHRLRKSRRQVKTHATIVRYLKLRGCVLDLISDYQLFWEECVRSRC